jgi:hypothetical protein
MGEQLLYIVLKHGAVCRTLENLREQDPVLGVSRQDMIKPVAVELSNLNWCYVERRPARSPEANVFVAARLIDEDKVWYDWNCVRL